MGTGINSRRRRQSGLPGELSASDRVILGTGFVVDQACYAVAVNQVVDVEEERKVAGRLLARPNQVAKEARVGEYDGRFVLADVGIIPRLDFVQSMILLEKTKRHV